MERIEQTEKSLSTWQPQRRPTSSASDGLTAGGMLNGGGDENVDNSGIMAREWGWREG